jgi:hypothetical protein
MILEKFPSLSVVKSQRLSVRELRSRLIDHPDTERSGNSNNMGKCVNSCVELYSLVKHALSRTPHIPPKKQKTAWGAAIK